jgi:hypothetical protein
MWMISVIGWSWRSGWQRVMNFTSCGPDWMWLWLTLRICQTVWCDAVTAGAANLAR